MSSAAYFDREGTRLRRVPSPNPQTICSDDYMHPQPQSCYGRGGHSSQPSEESEFDDFKVAGASSATSYRDPTYPPGAALPQRDHYYSRGYSAEDSPPSVTAFPPATPDALPTVTYQDPFPYHDHPQEDRNRTRIPPSLLHDPNHGAMNDEARADWDAAGVGTVRRNLAQKNLSMIAIAGTLGTGLFVASGEALANGGPVSLLISFSIMATVVYAIMSALGEMCTRYPLTSSFTHYAARFIDESAGFCLGITYWWSFALSVPTEISAAAIIIQYWDHSTDPAVYITVFIICVLSVNLLGVHYFGEVNFWLSLPKLITVVGLILLGFILALGGGPIPSTPDGWCLAFHCWQRPGAFAQLYGIAGAKGRFLGFWDTMLRAAYAYEGIEVIALTAGEASNPRNTMPTAIRHVLMWIVWSYIAAVVVMGWTVPFNAPGLPQDQAGSLNSLDVAQSPFVIAIRNAGIRALDSIINAVVLLSAFTAASVFLFGTSRSLIGLADEILVWSDERGRGEQGFVERCAEILRKCRRDGLPHYALAVTACFMPLAYALRGKGGRGTGSVYLNLGTLTGVSALAVWWMILVSYLQFYRACRLQHENRARFKYHAPLQPWLTYWGLFWVTLVLIFNGFDVFVAGRWDAGGFVASYITFPAVALAYFSWKWVYGTRIRNIADIDLASGAALYDEHDTGTTGGILQAWWTWAF